MWDSAHILSARSGTKIYRKLCLKKHQKIRGYGERYPHQVLASPDDMKWSKPHTLAKLALKTGHGI